MSEGKHSRAPFHRGGKDGQIVYDADGLPVANCTVYHGKADAGRMEANAKLFAAAPDLLAACKAALGCCNDQDSPLGVQLSSAIAQAEGKS